jgi:excisionase family DNA binding protein
MQGETKNAEDFLTVDEAARRAGISHWTVRSWLQKGLLTRYKSAFRTVVSEPELLSLLKPKRTEATLGQQRCKAVGLDDDRTNLESGF